MRISRDCDFREEVRSPKPVRRPVHEPEAEPEEEPEIDLAARARAKRARRFEDETR